jgi:hypothetical protein
MKGAEPVARADVALRLPCAADGGARSISVLLGGRHDRVLQRFARGVLPIVLAGIFALVAGCEPALHEAAKKGDAQAVRTILAGGVDVNARDYWGSTALHEAAEAGHPAVAQLLLDQGADVEAIRGGENGGTPLHDAAMRGHIQVIQILLDAGADVEALSAEGQPPIHFAARRGHEDAVALAPDIIAGTSRLSAKPPTRML